MKKEDSPQKRILLTVAYDGTDFSGFAYQAGKRTVEGALNEALCELTGEETEVIGASRTDAGVHAYGNLAAFDTSSPIPAERFARVLDRYLPRDLRIVRSVQVPQDYHPRHTGAIKTYEYRVLNTPAPDPIWCRYACHYGYELDVERMAAGARYLIGEHDFTSLCNPDTQSPTRVREITDARVMRLRAGAGLSLWPEGATEDRQHGLIVIRVSGRGFLYHQVRIIAGTLLEMGRGLKSPQDMPGILEARDRRRAGFTAPPQGLILMGYDPEGPQ